MNSAAAWRFVVASQDDPVLAAWVSVCHEYQVASAAEISPFDAWDAFEELLNHGIVSPVEYDETNTKKIFFSGHPDESNIQGVLERLRFLCPEHDAMEIEKTMSEDPFFSKSSALSHRPKASEHKSIAPRPSASLDDAFFPNKEVLPQPVHGPAGGLDMFANTATSSPEGLPCHSTDPLRGTPAVVGGQAYIPQVNCGRCGKPVEMDDDGSRMINDDSPGSSTDPQLLLALFSGKCHHCKLIHHFTVAEDQDISQLG